MKNIIIEIAGSVVVGIVAAIILAVLGVDITPLQAGILVAVIIFTSSIVEIVSGRLKDKK